ncbi:MAG: hypothetical protein K8R21_01930 [Leptospira sp.]|nr:hypothetical protein [Leptospira sp.]
MDYKLEKQKLMSAKTPEQYVERSLHSKIKRGEKGSITKEWIGKTGFSHEDILFARNRNPHWKKVKGKGSYQRTLQRIKSFNYSKTSAPKKIWAEKDLDKFYELNKTMNDWQLAKNFKASLPAINHIRRKLKIAKDILEIKKQPVKKDKIIKMALSNEKSLRTQLQDIS